MVVHGFFQRAKLCRTWSEFKDSYKGEDTRSATTARAIIRSMDSKEELDFLDHVRSSHTGKRWRTFGLLRT